MYKSDGTNVIGRILLALLLLIVLIPVLLYCYVCLFGHGITQRRAAYDPAAPYAGQIRCRANGDTELPLSELDLYYLGDVKNVYGKVNGKLGKNLRFTGYALELKEGGATVYADFVAFKIVPIPLRADVALSFSDGDMTVEVQKTWLGRFLPLQTEKLLARFDLSTVYSVPLDGPDAELTINDVSFQPGRAVLTVPFLKQYADAVSSMDATAAYIRLYEGPTVNDDPALYTALMCYEDGVMDKPAFIREQVAKSADPSDMMQALLSLCDPETAEAYLADITPFEARCFISSDPAGVAAARRALLSDVAAKQAKLEKLLQAVREKYARLELEIGMDHYNDFVTGLPLSLSQLYPGTIAADDRSRLVLLVSNSRVRTVLNEDMPMLSDVPRATGQDLGGVYKNLSYDVGLITRMPEGTNVLFHYSESGELVVYCLTDTWITDTMPEGDAPFAMMLGELPFPEGYDIAPSPGEGASAYVFYSMHALQLAWGEIF